MTKKGVKTAAVIGLLIALTAPITKLAYADPTDTTQIIVNAQVLPQADELEFEFTSPQTGTTLSQDKELEFTISYSNLSNAASSLTIQSSWDLGQVEGALNPSVDSLEYVIGSASNGYNGAAPTINLTSRTITWAMGSIPAHTEDQTVSFKLITTDNYTGDRDVTLPVTARVIDPITLTDQLLNFTYRYDAPDSTDSGGSSNGSTSSSPSPSPSSATTTTSSSSPTDSNSANSTPTPSLTRLNVTTLSSTNSEFSFSLNQPTTVEIRYGTSPTSLPYTITLLPGSLYNFSLANLQPATTYYFQMYDVDNQQLLTGNELYVFTTSQGQTALPEIGAPTFTLTHEGSVVFSGNSPQYQSSDNKIITLSNLTLETYLFLPDVKSLKRAEVFFRNRSILGATTEEPDLASQNASLTEISPGVFIAKIKTPPQSGHYQLMLRVEDIYGNLSERPIGEVAIIRPLKVVNANDGKPLANIKATFSSYNSQTRLFEIISNATTAIPNPSFSNEAGLFPLSLFPNRYQVELSHPNFEAQTIEFTIDKEVPEDLPIVELKPKSIFLFNIPTAWWQPENINKGSLILAGISFLLLPLMFWLGFKRGQTTGQKPTNILQS